MRTAIILARKHGAKKLELVSGTDVPARQQSEKFKDEFLGNGKVHDKFEYAELWDSGHGRTKSVRLSTVESAKKESEQAEINQKLYAEVGKANAELTAAREALGSAKKELDQTDGALKHAEAHSKVRPVDANGGVSQEAKESIESAKANVKAAKAKYDAANAAFEQIQTKVDNLSKQIK